MSTTDCDGSTGSSSSSAQWSDLPDELLGMVLLRLASPWARVRLAAVCKAWRAAMSPAVPLLFVWSWVRLISGTKLLCGPEGACVVRVPDKAENMRLVGSHDGGWVAAAFKHYKLVIVNFFSGAEVPLAQICSDTLITPKKIIFSEDPTSDGCILASIAKWERCQIGLCKIGGQGSRWTAQDMHTDTETVSDIVFCKGELYALLDPGEELVKFKIDMEEDGTPVITSHRRLAIERRHGPTCEDDPFAYGCHMVELHGKLLMAIQTRWLPNREPFFKVFTLVHTDNIEIYKYKWEEVTSFDDHALFVGWFSSKAIRVAVDQRHGLERNHIYYIHHKSSCTTELPDDVVYSVTIGDSQHMYCKEDQSVGDGVERTGYNVTGINDLGMWLYPPDS